MLKVKHYFRRKNIKTKYVKLASSNGKKNKETGKLVGKHIRGRWNDPIELLISPKRAPRRLKAVYGRHYKDPTGRERSFYVKAIVENMQQLS